MLFSKKEEKIVVKYQVKISPTGYSVKKKKVTKEEYDELVNDPDVRIIKTN